MAQTHTYDGATVLTTRRPESLEVAESAEFAEASIGQVSVDDDAGALDLVGWKRYSIDESAETAGNRNVWTGYTGKQSIKRSDQYGTIGASARMWDLTLVELNTSLGFKAITAASGNRSVAETPKARLEWLLAVSGISFVDNGHVDYPLSPTLDPTDYRGRTAADVLHDVSAKTGLDYWIEYNATDDVDELILFDFNRSTDLSITTKISNAGDENGTTIFAPLDPTDDEGLDRDPENIASRILVPFRRGFVVQEKAATAAAFVDRDLVAPDSDSKTRTAANAFAKRLLNENDEQAEEGKLAVLVPAAYVNQIRRGRRMQVRITHWPGYESYRWVRVKDRAIRMPAGHDLKYRLNLTVVPWTEPVVCDPDTATDLALTGSVLGYSDGPTSGGTDAHTYLSAPTNPGNVIDDDDFTNSSMNATTIDSTYTGQTFHRGWDITLAAPSRVGFVDIRKRIGDGWPDLVEYYVSGAWHDVTETATGFLDGLVAVQRYTFAAPIDDVENIRVTFEVYCGGGQPYGTSFDGGHNVDGIRVLECPA